MLTMHAPTASPCPAASRQIQLNLFPMVWPGYGGQGLKSRPVGDRTASLTQRQVAVLAALLAACGTPTLNYQVPSLPEGPSGWVDKPGWAMQRFAVAAANPLATDAGYQVLKAGGTAAKWAKLGHEVKLVSVTNGDIGHWREAGGPLALRRRREVEAAA